MKKSDILSVLVVSLALPLWGAGPAGTVAVAVAGGGGGNQGFAGGGGGRNQDPTQQLQRRIDNLRTQLLPTDDGEWKVLSDKIMKVMLLQTQLQAGRQTNVRGGGGGGGAGFGAGGGGFGGGGPGGGGGGAGYTPPVDQTNPVAVAAADLSTTTQDPTTDPEVLKAKLAALREARKKLQADLTKAQQDLKDVVTIRQEAVLVNSAILE